MKKTKLLAIMLTLVTLFSSFAVFSIGASAAGAWDGVTVDVAWYVDNQSSGEYILTTPEQLAGLSVICYSCDAGATPTGEKVVYYDENKHAILDAAKITPETKSVPFNKFKGKNIKIGADIDLGGKAFVPIGNSGSFQGNFDGQNYKITNLYVDAVSAQHKSLGYKAPKEQYYYGLFAFVAGGATVKNVVVENAVFDVNMKGGVLHCYVGGIAGAMHNDGPKLENCKVNNLKVNFAPTEEFEPGINADTGDQMCLIGAAIGRHGSSQTQSGLVVTGFEIVNTSNSDKYTQNENVIYGGLTGASAIPKFENCSVTFTDGKTVTPGSGSSSGEVEPPPPPEDDGYEEETKAPEKKPPVIKDNTTTKAPSATQTEEDNSNTTLIIIISAAAAVVVIAVVVVIIVAKKKKS